MRRTTTWRQSRAPAPAGTARGRHRGPTLPFAPVPASEAGRITAAALQLLAEIGIRFEPGTEADDLLARAGCEVRPEGVVRIPEPVVRRALEGMARATRLWDREGASAIDIDDCHTWFMPGMTCIKVPDPETGAPRDSTADDLALIARIADGLPDMDAVCVAVKDVPNSTMQGEIGEFAIMARNTVKPLEYLCEHAESLDAVIAMATALRGSPQALAEKPWFLHIITPLPLFYAADHCRQVIAAARAGVPVSCGTLAIGGASAPITTAGCLVHCLATDFAGMVLGQAACEGAFCVGSTNPYFMEVATGGIGNLAQTMLGEQLICQIRRDLGIPSFTAIGGDASAARFGQDAVFEIATMMGQIFHTRPATCDYLGSLDQGIVFSLPALLLCDDFAGLLRTLWRGTVIDDDTLALDVLREVGLTGTVLGHEHTARHCRDCVWDSRYFGANAPLTTTGLPFRELSERIDEDLRRRIAAPPPPPLPEAVAREFDAILARSG